MVEKRGNVSFVKSNNFHFHYERKTHWSGISEGWTDAYVVPFKKTKKKNVCGFSACSWKTPATNYVLATHVLQMIYESGSDFSYHMNRSDQARLQRRLLVLDSHQEPPIKYSGGEGVAPALNNAVFTHLKRPLHLLHRMWHHSAHKVAFTHLIVEFGPNLRDVMSTKTQRWILLVFLKANMHTSVQRRTTLHEQHLRQSSIIAVRHQLAQSSNDTVAPFVPPKLIFQLSQVKDNNPWRDLARAPVNWIECQLK